MAELSGYERWTITVDTREMLLLLKALGGRLREGEIEAAKQLGDDLTARKAKHIEAALRENQKLLSNLANKKNP